MMLPGLCSARSKTLFWTGVTLAIVAILQQAIVESYFRFFRLLCYSVGYLS